MATSSLSATPPAAVSQRPAFHAALSEWHRSSEFNRSTKIRPKFAVLWWSACRHRRGGNLRLTELMDGGAALRLPAGAREPDITGLTADSRAVQRGFLFAALPGTKLDGKRFIGDALARGAAALLLEDTTGVDAAVPVVTDLNPRQRFAKMAASFHTPQPKTIVAVTGTNGKTSVTVFLREIWAALGHKAASLGTIGLFAPGI